MPKAAVSKGKPQPACAQAPKRTSADVTLPQLQCPVVEAGPEGGGVTEATKGAAEGMTMTHEEAQSAEGQRRVQRAKEGGWQGADRGGAGAKERAKTQAVAGGEDAREGQRHQQQWRGGGRRQRKAKACTAAGGYRAR